MRSLVFVILLDITRRLKYSMNTLTSFFIKYRYWLIFIVLISLYLGLTAPALLDTDHVFLNLEPYPDSMYYVGSAKQMVDNHVYNLQYRDGDILKNTLPPLYPAYLAVFFVFSSNIWMVYVANLLLGVLTFSTLFLLLRKLTENWLATVFGSLAFCTFFYLYLLPGLPMTENLSLFLFTLVTYLLILGKNSWKWVSAGAISIIGLLLSRYAIMTTAVVAGALLFVRQFAYTAKKRKPLVLGLALLVTLLAWMSLLLVGISPTNLVKSFSQQLLDPANIFFSLRYFVPNIQAFAGMFFLGRGSFLWISQPMTTWPIAVLFIAGLVSAYVLKGRYRWAGVVLLSLFLSQFIVMLVFYVVDARYVVYSLPLFAVSIAMATLYVQRFKTKWLLLGLIGVLLGIQLFFQKDLARQTVAQNILGRSSAWQYQAVQHFNRFFSQRTASDLEPKAVLITALPPFYVDLIDTQSYEVAPLSKSQEYLGKNQYVWGQTYKTDDPVSKYQQLVAEGKELYLSNAYITHHRGVLADFERYKEVFSLQLVSEGCQGTCNIYLLQPVSSNPSP